MKKIFLVALLTLVLALPSRAVNIINNSTCEICVLVSCYNGCSVAWERWYNVAPGTSINVQDCGDCTTYKLYEKASPDLACEDHGQLPARTIHPAGFGACIGFPANCPSWFQLATTFTTICGVTAQMVNSGTLLIQ